MQLEQAPGAVRRGDNKINTNGHSNCNATTTTTNNTNNHTYYHYCIVSMNNKLVIITPGGRPDAARAY